MKSLLAISSSLAALLAGCWLGTATQSLGDVLWLEGERPVSHSMTRHPSWYDRVQRERFSGGDFLSNFSKDQAGEAEYRFTAPAAGDYDFWVRANPVQAKLSFQLNGGTNTAIDLTRSPREQTNVAADGKPDLRFLAWVKADRITLKAGSNTIRFRMDSANSHHGYLDCFVFANEPFKPRGITKPGEMARAAADEATANEGWFPFDPPADPFNESPLDLRRLNERFAGEHGFIGANNGQFIHTATGEPVRFWAVNGPPSSVKDPAELRRVARLLAKRGVNLVRIHGAVFTKDGEPDPAKVQHVLDIVEAMKAEGIYSHCSIYFPLWFTPRAGLPWLEGYDGKKHPFAALQFNRAFQAKYREWWRALLLTPGTRSGRTLIEERAVMGLEMQNEDSFFFWTFAENNLPDPQLRLFEKLFGDWLVKKYGSLDAAFAKWNAPQLKRDAPTEGRVAFRPLWNLANEKTARDQDTAAFLLEVQTQFYAETYAFLRGLGFKGQICASNWATASPEVLGPLEKLSYLPGDFIDRHGYFGGQHKGDNSEWSIRDGHVFADRSGLRFDPAEPGKSKAFVHPAMDPHYDDKPSMISETTWTRPNRFRPEAPLYFAAYGALQASDAIVHFAFDGADWSVKPGFWMQPWTLMSPAMLGQFPATALIYRQGLIAPGAVVAEVNLNRGELTRLQGTPLPQDASFDELRLKDVPTDANVKPGQRLDPLLHYVGQTRVRFTDGSSKVQPADTGTAIDRKGQTVTSSTGELRLDYGKGVLTVNSPRAQGAGGDLKAAGEINLRDLVLSSELDLAHILLVPLDGRPIATSNHLLLQVMSEEKPTGWTTEPAENGRQRITSIGRDPWLVKELNGQVHLKRADAAELKVTALDANGYPAGDAGTAATINLQPRTIYYLISR